ncbi:MAG: CDP-alcohol phosphatidyltransferase family protein [Crocinitomicaceae bacterium]|nr:CDP-alcohol phosphatidyltransferase family protein [Crocinitomicaceae bacterium]
MFNVPNLFTAANMISGIIAILFALMGRIDLAPWAIFAGAVFDFFDGFLARKMGVSGELGKQMDSLADMVTFGLAPGVIMMVVLTIDVAGFLEASNFEVVRYDFFYYLESLMSGRTNDFTPFVALLIPFFSLFRLAKFNIDTRQSESFIGFPTPANTLFFMTFPLVLSYSSNGYSEMMEVMFHPVTLSVFIVVMSILLVSEFPMFSLKFKSFGWRSNQIRYLFLLISSVLIVLFSTWSIALIVFLYLILSFVDNVFLKKKKNEV